MSKSEVLLNMEHSIFTILPHLCLNFPVKDAYFPRPEWGAVDSDSQVFSPVTPLAKKPSIGNICSLQGWHVTKNSVYFI